MNLYCKSTIYRFNSGFEYNLKNKFFDYKRRVGSNDRRRFEQSKTKRFADDEGAVLRCLDYGSLLTNSPNITKLMVA